MIDWQVPPHWAAGHHDASPHRDSGIFGGSRSATPIIPRSVPTQYSSAVITVITRVVTAASEASGEPNSMARS